MDTTQKYRKDRILESLKDKGDNTLLLPCDCDTHSHITAVRAFRDNGASPLEIHIEASLRRQPDFFGRLLIAFFYIFGSDEMNYEYDTNILNEYQVTKLRDFLNKKLKEN